MKSLRILDRRVGSLLAAFAFVVASVAPTLLTATVSADVLQDRSIQLSSAAVNATPVDYAVTFKVAANAAAFVIDFCNESPLIGSTCTVPTDFTSAGVTTSTTNYTASQVGATTNIVKMVKTAAVTAGGTATFTLSNIHNPSVANDSTHGLYARITTYTDDTGASAHTSATVIGTPVDQGAVALAIVPVIGVSAAVLESMTFCVSGTAVIGANCSSNVTTPSLTLGESTGGVKALSSGAVSTGIVYTQISTNASTGAVIRMKSTATDCGGLLRAGGGSACNIGPATSGITAGNALFGVKTGTPYATVVGAGSATGTYQPATGSSYNDSTYFMHFVSGNGTGVTSPYGDPFLDTNDLPINNQNMDLTFGASVGANTPAGLYSADLSLIAAGKF